MQLAINDLVQRDFHGRSQSAPFRIDPLLVTRAYEELKSVTFNGVNGQQLQEFLITSILKYYLEIANPKKNYFLVIPDNASYDSILVESQKDDEFRKIGNDKLLATADVTVRHFQIKEMREEGDLIKNISSEISEAKEERLHETNLFQKFEGYFKNKILKRDYSDTILLLFLRAPSYMAFNTKELIEEFKKLNGGYFKNIWFIAAVEKLVGENGKELAINTKEGMNFHFYIKELIKSDPDWFTVVNIGCKFNRSYRKS